MCASGVCDTEEPSILLPYLHYMSFSNIVGGIVIMFVRSTPPYSHTPWSQVPFDKSYVTSMTSPEYTCISSTILPALTRG